MPGKKRKNPKTGKTFKRGDVREDGYIFTQYRTTRPLKKDGSYQESWIHPDKFRKREEVRFDAIKVNNPETKKPWKYGDVRSRDGYIFSHYRKKSDNRGLAPMIFMSPAAFKKKSLDGKDYKKKKYIESRQFEGNKRLNPLTGRPFKDGDVRDDGYIFCQYLTTAIRNDGYFGESWLNPKSYHRSKIKNIVMNTRTRAKKKNIPSNLTIDYCVDIYPEDNKCPVLGIPLNWGGRRTNGDSPSLDRIVPSKGYVKGNVMWMCHRANAMKSNATSEELKKFALWIKNSIK